MARQWDETGHAGDDELALFDRDISFLVAVWALEETVKRLSRQVGRLSRFAIRARRLDAQREAAPDVEACEAIGHVEPVNASAMIPEEQIQRADRGGE